MTNDAEPLHIVDQSGQPYGSVRRCCSRCGKMCWPGVAGSATRWVDDWAEYDEHPDRCCLRKEQADD